MTPDAAESVPAEVAGADDPPSDVDPLTQRRPVHEVVENGGMIDVPVSRLVGETLDPDGLEIEILKNMDVGMLELPDPGPVITEDETLDVGIIEDPLIGPLGLIEVDGGIDDGRVGATDDDPDGIEEPPIILLEVEIPGVEGTKVPLIEPLGFDREPDVETTEIALFETPVVPDKDPVTEDAIPDVETPEVDPPSALLTLAARDPRPEVDILDMDVVDVPLNEIVRVPEMIPVSEVDTLDVDRSEVALTKILGLPTPVIDGEIPAVEVTEVPLIKKLGFPEREVESEGDALITDVRGELDGKISVTVEKGDVIEDTVDDTGGDDVPGGMDNDGDEKPVDEAEPVVDCNTDGDVAERPPERDIDIDGEPFEELEDPTEDP